MSLTTIVSPNYIDLNNRKVSLFLGGSIEAGVSRDWQKELIQELNNKDYASELEILNPRRAAWDATWPVDDPDNAILKEQITWELDHQDKADILIYNFAAQTIAPITLLELGTYAPRKPIINIERGYKRHANVKITAEHFGWSYSETWPDFITLLDQCILEALRLKTAQI